MELLQNGKVVHYYPHICVVSTRKGLKWLDEQDKKRDNDEDTECTISDLVDLCHTRLIGVKKVASLRTLSEAIRPHYEEAYGNDTCYPRKKHIARAFKLGLIRLELLNSPGI